MRKLSLLAASLAVMPLVSTAQAADQTGKVYYKDGTRIETQDFDLKINLQVQPKFTFSDKDEGARRDIGLDSAEDTTSFDVRRVQAFFSGNLLDKEFSYKLQTDLRSQGGGSQLKDAWLQWNAEGGNPGTHIRWGQFKTPFSRQDNAGDEQLEFIDRSKVSDFFSPNRNMGAMIHGPLGDESVNYFLETYNGESDGEGINTGGVDNKLAVLAAVTAVFGEYGSRGSESDLRDDNSSTAFTAGVSTIYGQASGDPLGVDAASDFDHFDLNVDGGMRSNGFSAQTEFYYRTVNLDDVSGPSSDGDVFGFYVQSGYVIDKLWEVAGRFGYIDYDKDFSAIDDQEEYNLVVNYFIHGHYLKIQSGITWDVSNYSGSSDVTDFRFETQLSGYF
ncbi:MAG: porin [Bdellovibrionota bacterium]